MANRHLKKCDLCFDTLSTSGKSPRRSRFSSFALSPSKGRRRVFHQPVNLFSALLFVFTVSAVFAQEKAPAGSGERGYQAYMKYRCDACHGTIGQGGDRGVGPKLAPNPMSYDAFAKQTRTPREGMPAYRAPFLSDQDLADIYAYMLSIKPSPATKDIPLLDF